MEGAAFRAGASTLLLAALLWGCTSASLHRDETGGSGGGGALGSVSSTGGAPGMSGAGGFIGEPRWYPGSCAVNQPNPDAVNGGSCSASQADPPPRCTQDCCITCGIDATGTSVCVCDVATGAYASCTCTPPVGFPTGLTGGACSPQGYATSLPPQDGISLKGIPCTKTNVVCFTADSTPASQRGCICLFDGTMHCGSVHGWFTQIDGETTYN